MVVGGAGPSEGQRPGGRRAVKGRNPVVAKGIHLRLDGLKGRRLSRDKLLFGRSLLGHSQGRLQLLLLLLGPLRVLARVFFDVGIEGLPGVEQVLTQRTFVQLLAQMRQAVHLEDVVVAEGFAAHVTPVGLLARVGAQVDLRRRGRVRRIGISSCITNYNLLCF